MGRSTTPTHIIRFTEVRSGERIVGLTPAAWPTRKDRGGGRPTKANLARYVEGTNESCQPGGVNEHLAPMRIVRAEIVNQHTGEIKARYPA